MTVAVMMSVSVTAQVMVMTRWQWYFQVWILVKCTRLCAGSPYSLRYLSVLMRWDVCDLCLKHMCIHTAWSTELHGLTLEGFFSVKLNRVTALWNFNARYFSEVLIQPPHLRTLPRGMTQRQRFIEAYANITRNIVNREKNEFVEF